MSSEVHPLVVEAAVLPPPITIRSLTDWYKNTVVVLSGLEYQTGANYDYIQTAWIAYVTQLADEQQVPIGWLSAAIYELAQYEIRMINTALDEGGVEIFDETSD